MNPDSPNPLLVILAGLLSVLAVALATACSDDDASAPSAPATNRTGGTGQVAPDGSLAELVAGASDGDVVSVPAGIYHESIAVAKAVTIQPAGDGEVIIDGECQTDTAVTIAEASNVTIRGLQLRNFTGAAIFIGGGSEGEPAPGNITIDGMTITDFNCLDDAEQYKAAIAVSYSDCCMRITNNTINYRTEEQNARGHGDGIWFKSKTGQASGGGHYIAGNTISGGWDGIGGEVEDDPQGSFDGDTIIENNTITGCWDDGIQVEGGDDNVTVRDNVITGCGTGIALAPVLAGPLTIERNVIRDLVTGMLDNQFCFKVGDNSTAVAYLTENVCQTEGKGVLQTNEGASWLVLEGNCFSVSSSVLEVGELADGSAMNGNYLWTTSDTHFIDWEGTRYASIAEFRRATGNEQTGQQTQDCPLDIG